MNVALMQKNLKKLADKQEVLADTNQAIKDSRKEFNKPARIPASKAPTGKGVSKGDILVQRLATEFQYDPIKELITIARGKHTSSELQYKIACQLADYYLPKVKAIDVNPNEGEVISLNIVFPE